MTVFHATIESDEDQPIHVYLIFTFTETYRESRMMQLRKERTTTISIVE